jgi:hypothetical protein
MKMLSEIAIEPLRIAFDDMRFKKTYVDKVRLAAEFGIHEVSNYILYNYNDTPEELYERLRINIELNEEFQKRGLDTYIWSFPMRYSPITGEDCFGRQHVGPHWNKKFLRAVRCILLATRGLVGPKREFFEKSFGRDLEEFLSILSLPEHYIIYRDKNIKNGKQTQLAKMISRLSDSQTDIFNVWVRSDRLHNIDGEVSDKSVRDILKIYKGNK